MEWPGYDGVARREFVSPSRARTFPARPGGRDEPANHARERFDRAPRPIRLIRPPRRVSTLDASGREGPQYFPRRPRRVGIIESDAESVRESSRERDDRRTLRSRESTFKVRGDGQIEEVEIERDPAFEDDDRGYPVVIDTHKSGRSHRYDDSEDGSDDEHGVEIYDFSLPDEGLASPDIKTVGLASPEFDSSASEAQFDSISSARTLAVDRSEYTGEYSMDGDHGVKLTNRGRSPLFRWM